MIKGILYKKGFSRPYLRCLIPKKVDYVMREVHEGVCGNHSESQSLVHKLIRAGYYWPTMQKDAIAHVKTCDKCQRFANLIRQPLEELTPIMASWPFAQWGIGHHGLVPNSNATIEIPGGQYRLLHVGRSRSTGTITERNVRCFVWKNIVCRYYIPRVLIFDNEKQFDNDAFRDFCLQLGIKNHYSSSAHP